MGQRAKPQEMFTLAIYFNQKTFKMKLTPEKIYEHFNTIRDGVELDGKLLWFCIESISLREWNETAPREQHLRHIDIYLMAKNGCHLSTRSLEQTLTNLMGSETYRVQICPIENDLIKRKGFFFELSEREIPSKVSDKISVEDLFHINRMSALGVVVTEDDGQYGRGYEKKTGGWKQLSWNREGFGVSYLGVPLEKNSAVEIKLDGGTRTGFHGMVRNAAELELVINLTR